VSNADDARIDEILAIMAIRRNPFLFIASRGRPDGLIIALYEVRYMGMSPDTRIRVARLGHKASAPLHSHLDEYYWRKLAYVISCPCDLRKSPPAAETCKCDVTSNFQCILALSVADLIRPANALCLCWKDDMSDAAARLPHHQKSPQERAPECEERICGSAPRRIASGSSRMMADRRSPLGDPRNGLVCDAAGL